MLMPAQQQQSNAIRGVWGARQRRKSWAPAPASHNPATHPCRGNNLRLLLLLLRSVALALLLAVALAVATHPATGVRCNVWPPSVSFTSLLNVVQPLLR